jgi:hypothetical protein
MPGTWTLRPGVRLRDTALSLLIISSKEGVA